MDEKWKFVKGTNNMYQVSNLGGVRSVDRYARNRYKPIFRKGVILKPSFDGCKYQQVQIFINGKRTIRKVHRLVAEAFLGHKLSMEVNHIDGNKTNNIVSNLEWMTHKENMRHAKESGLFATDKFKAASIRQRKFSDDEIDKIRGLCNAGLSQSTVAGMYGVSQSVISRIVLFKSYKTSSRVV